MEKVIYNKYDKARIQQLPRALFEGKIVVVLSESEAARAVDFLLSQPILGVDTETRPSFRKGVKYYVSLLQVSTRDICFLFRLKHTTMCDSIIRLLEDTTVPKIGLSLHDDIHSLREVAQFSPGLFIDIQHKVKDFGVEDLSLQKLYANFLGGRISKGQRLTNWEADVLSESQKRYAATDAWACILLYEEMERLRQTGEYEVIMNMKKRHIFTGLLLSGLALSLVSCGKTETPEDPNQNETPGTDNPGTDNPGTDNPGTDNPGTDNPNPTPDPGKFEVQGISDSTTFKNEYLVVTSFEIFGTYNLPFIQ